MEKSNDVYVECVDIGWSDLGSWGAYYEKSPKAEHRNVIHNCRTVLNNCENNIFAAKTRNSSWHRVSTDMLWPTTTTSC